MENLVELQYKEITDKILHAFFEIVYAQFGYGFLEKVYENALTLALYTVRGWVSAELRFQTRFSSKSLQQ